MLVYEYAGSFFHHNTQRRLCSWKTFDLVCVSLSLLGRLTDAIALMLRSINGK